MRTSFFDDPEPLRVSWAESRVERSVSVVFAEPEVCRICHGPPGGRPTRLKRVTIYFKPHSTVVTGLSGRAT